jgi:hypothetical protein
MSAQVSLCHPYAWEDPRYLFGSLWLPSKTSRCASEYINQILFVYLFAGITGFLAMTFTGVGSAPLIALIAASLYLLPSFQGLQHIYHFRKGATDASGEGFQNILKPSEYNNTGVDGTPSTLPFQDETTPDQRNPFYNITMDEYPTMQTEVGGYKPKAPGADPNYVANRPAAPDITSLKSKLALDDLFRVQWFSDPTDVWGKTQSQRIFISQPSTTIPNDQDSYQKWLYKIPGKTCKEGNAEACYGGTEGALLPWLNF